MEKEGRIANARIGYQVAVNLLIYEGQILWSRCNAMLVANSITLAVIGLFSRDKIVIGHLDIRVLVSVSGIFLCLAWTAIVSRGHQHFRLWNFEAGRLEKILDPAAAIFRDDKLVSGKAIEIGEKTPIKMRRFGRLRIVWSMYMIIIIFSLIYLTILLLLLFR